MKEKYVLCSLACMVILSCTITGSKNFIAKPSKEKSYEITKAIKLNGCYYGVCENPIDGSTELCYFFFYENGVALFSHAGEIKKDSIIFREYLRSNIEKDMLFKANFFKSKEAGGCSMNLGKVQLQIYRYVPSLTWALSTFNGNIINDSTIYISSCEMKKRPDYCRDKFYLRFIEMLKPDSTHQLMKKSWYWEKEKMLVH